jgi:hypothetical protein
MIITSNQIRNLPINIEDVNIAETIFGPDIVSLKGKTTRQKRAPVVSDFIEIPEELITNHNNAVLCIDGMRINGAPFLTTISCIITYRIAEWIPSQTSKAYRSVLDNIFSVYNMAGIKL